MTNRRQFLQGAVGAAGLAGLHAAGVFSSSATAAEITPADQKLKLLVLGGTGFIGPHEINHALARGHEVTMFNRGNRAGLYGGRVEEIVGNRDDKIDAGLEPLRGDRTWDVVVDNSGYVTRHVRDSVALLGDRCARYIYISTVAAYDFSTPSHFDEDGPLDGMKDPNDEQVTWETYGPLKADCDKLVRDALGKKATVVRPAYIIGPGDHRPLHLLGRTHPPGRRRDRTGSPRGDGTGRRRARPLSLGDHPGRERHPRRVQCGRLSVDPRRSVVGHQGDGWS